MKNFIKSKSVTLALIVLAVVTMLSATANLSRLAITLSTINSTSIGQTTPGLVAATDLKIQGLTNNSGMQTIRVGSCTTPGTQPGTCNTTVTWPVSMGDTNYTYGCSSDSADGKVAFSVTNSASKTATQFVVVVANVAPNAIADSTTLNCWGIHDAI